MFGRKTTLTVLTGALVAVGTVGGGAAVWAASAKPAPGPGDQINACAGKHGILRLSVHRDCRHREFPISWNRQGPPGPSGPPGPNLNGTVAAVVMPPSSFKLTGTWQDVTGLSLSLPTAGTYLITANVRGVIVFGAGDPIPNCQVVARLATGAPATPVSGSDRVVVTNVADSAATAHAGIGQVEATAPISMIVVGAAGTTVSVQGKAPGSACPTNGVVAISSTIPTVSVDFGPASTLNAIRIN